MLNGRTLRSISEALNCRPEDVLYGTGGAHRQIFGVPGVLAASANVFASPTLTAAAHLIFKVMSVCLASSVGSSFPVKPMSAARTKTNGLEASTRLASIDVRPWAFCSGGRVVDFP